MRNKVITMVSKDYFQFGKRLLETRHIIDADFVCYGPDLTQEQISILSDHNIAYKTVNQDIWNNWMQSLKFQFIVDEIDNSGGGITFVDWDTYFLNDWGGIFNQIRWDFGITIRNNFIDQNKCHRAWANGGVIFAKNNNDSEVLCNFALQVIEIGTHPLLPEYDEIWKTLEEGRPPEKTHYRTNKRWWCDQILLSALVMNYCEFDIKLFDCKQYNNIWDETPDTYIMHLKEKSGASAKFKDGNNEEKSK